MTGHCTDCEEYDQKSHSCPKYCKVITETVKELREESIQMQWIPVSDRLPEEKGEYLVTYHPCYWDDVEDEIRVGIDTFRGRTTWAKKKYQRVIAWMPLPEPYEGDI